MAKSFKLIVSIAVISAVVTVLYPSSSEFLHTIRAHVYPYPYTAPVINAVDTSAMPPARAVPILMYHGVIARGDIGPNTSSKEFIQQMEMLKREGYETITVDEYYRFRLGEFVLPPKPIIITFDDGRNDSYYTVDEAFKALGFEATMFIATIKANTNDSFYLGWNELQAALASGRWEMEAHGRHSHDEVRADAEGSLGTYLVTRIFTPGTGQESIEEYKARVDADYQAGMTDLKDHLGVDAHYYAVPLNSYGKLELSNYEDAYAVNLEFTKKHFRLAFVEVSAREQALESFYNDATTDPYEIKRLEVKNMTTVNLLASLEAFAPLAP